MENLAKQWTKMQEWSFICMKLNFAFVQLDSLCICLPIGPRSVVLKLELCTLLLVFLFSFLQKVSGQQILARCIKDFVSRFVAHIHASIQNIYLAWIPKCLPSSYFIIFFQEREILEKFFFLFTIFNDPEQGRDKIATTYSLWSLKGDRYLLCMSYILVFVLKCIPGLVLSLVWI